MYSYEIDDLFRQLNYKLESYNILYNIQNNSPQISRIKVEQYLEKETKYFVQTNDNYQWYIYIKNYSER